MYIIVIAVIAAAILIFFSFKPADVPQPELVNETLEDVAAGATVKLKTVENDPTTKRSHLKYFAVFTLDDGADIEFLVGPETYNALNVGDRDTLVYRGDVFIGFGDVGAAAEPAESAEAAPDADGFTLDDYDETIDVEIPMDMETSGTDRLEGADQKDYELFMAREKLPLKTESIADETGSFEDYPAAGLLEKTTIYPFLKRESEVRRMFLRTYSEALKDMRGYAGDSRTGRAADSVLLRKNEIRLAITVTELPNPLPNRVEAEFGVNE